MTIQPIINFYGSQPANPAIHEQVAIHMRKNVRQAAGIRGSGGVGNDGKAVKAAAERDKYRAFVWAMADAGLSMKAISRVIKKSPNYIARILSEPRP